VIYKCTLHLCWCIISHQFFFNVHPGWLFTYTKAWGSSMLF